MFNNFFFFIIILLYIKKKRKKKKKKKKKIISGVLFQIIKKLYFQVEYAKRMQDGGPTPPLSFLFLSKTMERKGRPVARSGGFRRGGGPGCMWLGEPDFVSEKKKSCWKGFFFFFFFLFFFFKFDVFFVGKECVSRWLPFH